MQKFIGNHHRLRLTRHGKISELTVGATFDGQLIMVQGN